MVQSWNAFEKKWTFELGTIWGNLKWERNLLELSHTKAKSVYYLPKVAAQCKAVFFVVGVSMTDISIPALNSLAICSSLGIKNKEILLFQTIEL